MPGRMGRNGIHNQDPETAHSEHIGDSLEDWVPWLLDNPTINGIATLARFGKTARVRLNRTNACCL